MSFFEEAVSKVKKAADTVGKNAGMVIDSGKLKVMEAELKGEVKKSYEALGKLVYEAKTDGSDACAQVEEAVAAITELKAKLAEIDEQQLRLAKKAQCENCGEVNPIEASFCAKCGAKIEKAVDPEPCKAEATQCGCGCCGEPEAPKTEDNE